MVSNKMNKFEKLLEEYVRFNRKLQEFVDEGWWDTEYVLDELEREVNHRKVLMKKLGEKRRENMKEN